jgi:NAD+ diphosphatase
MKSMSDRTRQSDLDDYERSSLNAFAAHTIDRATTLRKDEAWVAERLKDSTSIFVPLRDSKLLVAQTEGPHAVLLSFSEASSFIQSAHSIVLLGVEKGRAIFAIDLGSDDPSLAALAERGRFRDLRTIAALLNGQEAALLAYAKAMAYWHHCHSFCGSCGSSTASKEGGHLRVCTNVQCGQQHFPRTDPAIIVLVTLGERCLLARQASWPEHRYSVIAGFVEPGESLESAVLREVLEETKIRVKAIHFHSSQPWPFPASIMLGFTAEAVNEAIQLVDGELQDARWYSRAEIKNAIKESSLRLPPKISISYRLIEDWFDESSKGSLEKILKTGQPIH